MSQSYKEERASYTQRFFSRPVSGRAGQQEEIRTTPLVSLAAKYAVDRPNGKPAQQPVLPQYGLLGFNMGGDSDIDHLEPIMLNTNAPNSTFICGSQGSGKSYTLASMLESYIFGEDMARKKNQLVAGVVFHYDKDTKAVAEAARLCSRGIKTQVLVSKSSAATDISDRYLALAGAKKALPVQNFVLQDHHLTSDSMLKLMAFSDQEGTVPLYMEVIQRLLRETAISGSKRFSFQDFRMRLRKEKFSPQQEVMMNMRLDLLTSFMAKSQKEKQRDHFKLEPGTLTIVDFSDPLIDPASACVLFDICLSLFTKHNPKQGLVVACDEAHKFLNKSAAAASFTDNLLTTVREQRHNATRVIIATQEPTISEKLLDLCSTSIVHRFSSPAWYASIKGLLGAASLAGSSEQQEAIFRRILSLGVGESLVFSPSSFVCMEDGKPKKLGANIMTMKTRLRLGVDGGMSVLASG